MNPRVGEVLMIGTAPEGKGGIASVVSVYRDHSLFDRYGVRYVATHRAGTLGKKLWHGLFGGLTVLGSLVFGRVAVVHAHVASYGSFKRKSVYLALARAFGVQTVFHLHGGEFKKFTDELASPRLRRWIVHTIQRSSEVVALSDSWAAYLRTIAPGARVRVIANPVFLPESSSTAREVEGRVLFLGRSVQSKGVFDLLDSFVLVLKRYPLACLAIGGDGELDEVRTRAKKLGIDDRVEVLGWIVAGDKETEMAKAQVFVLPSYDEGLPMAMLEAMAQGKAVVVTPVGGIPEAVQDGMQGVMVRPGAVADLAQALISLLGDADLRERLGRAARARVAERFSTERVLGQMGALYEELGVKPRASNE